MSKRTRLTFYGLSALRTILVFLDLIALSLLAHTINTMTGFSDYDNEIVLSTVAKNVIFLLILFLIKPVLWFLLQKKTFAILAKNEVDVGSTLQAARFSPQGQKQAFSLTQDIFSMTTGTNLIAQRIPLSASLLVTDVFSLALLAGIALYFTPFQSISALICFLTIAVLSHELLIQKVEIEGKEFLKRNIDLGDSIRDLHDGYQEIRVNLKLQ